MPDKDEKYIVKVNDFTFTITREEAESADIVTKSDDTFHLLKNHRSVTAKVIESDIYGKKLRMEVEDDIFDIEVKDALAQMLDQMGYGKGGGKQVKQVKAPMPGLVLQVGVSEGQDVKEGERLLILEAMKMENSINMHADGKIKKINVKNGQAVDKNQVLIELE